MYSKNLPVEERELLCYDYFHKYKIINRDQLRESLKSEPIDGVTVRFAEEMLVDYLELQRQIQKNKEDILTSDSKRKTAVVINDLHIPYHDENSLNAVFDFIIDTQPEYLVLNGDIIDCYGLSRFIKRPDRHIMLQDEIDMFYRMFKNLRKSIPNTEIHYNFGNHEDRITKITMDNGGGLWKLDSLTPETLLKLDKLNIIYHECTFTINGLIFTHGTYISANSSYSAKKELEAHNMQSGMSGHTHRMGIYCHSYKNDVRYWCENGCLCTLEPDYIKDKAKANWQQGFAVVTFVDDTNYTNQVYINNHSFIYNNKLYK